MTRKCSPPGCGQHLCLRWQDHRSGFSGTPWSRGGRARGADLRRPRAAGGGLFACCSGAGDRSTPYAPFVARVRALQVAVPSLVEPPTGPRDLPDIAMEFEEEEEEAEEEEEEEEVEELELFDESIDRFKHSSFQPLHGWAMRQRVESHVRTRRTRAPSSFSSSSRSLTCQCRRSWLSSRRRLRSSLWMRFCHRSWENRGWCADHTTGGCPCSRACSQEELSRWPSSLHNVVIPVLQFRNK